MLGFGVIVIRACFSGLRMPYFLFFSIRVIYYMGWGWQLTLFWVAFLQLYDRLTNLYNKFFITQKMSWADFSMANIDYNYQDQSSIPYIGNSSQSEPDDDTLGDMLLGSEFKKINNKKKRKGKYQVMLFDEVLWLDGDGDGPRGRVLVDGLRVIYGDYVKGFNNQDQILEYIRERQQKVSEIEVAVSKNPENYTLIPVFLIICTPQCLPFYLQTLASLPQVYNQCILFRPATQKKHEHIYGTIKQIYDIIAMVYELEKGLVHQYETDLYQMYQRFNLELDPNVGVAEGEGQGEGEEREGEGNRSGLQVEPHSRNNLSQQQQHQQPQPQQQQQPQPQQASINPDFHQIQQKIVSDLLSANFQIILDPTYVSFTLITDQATKQAFEQQQKVSQSLVVKTKKQVEAFISEQERCPWLIIISSPMQNVYEIVQKCQRVFAWVRCLWGCEKLGGEDEKMFEERYGGLMEISPNFEDQVFNVYSLEEMSKKLDELQTNLQDQIME